LKVCLSPGFPLILETFSPFHFSGGVKVPPNFRNFFSLWGVNSFRGGGPFFFPPPVGSRWWVFFRETLLVGVLFQISACWDSLFPFPGGPFLREVFLGVLGKFPVLGSCPRSFFLAPFRGACKGPFPLELPQILFSEKNVPGEILPVFFPPSS